MDACPGLPLPHSTLRAREENSPPRQAAPEKENLVDLARQDKRISSKVFVPALVQAVTTLVLAALEGPEDGATLGMAVATMLTAAVGWVKADCRYVNLRQQFSSLPAGIGEGQFDKPD